MMRNLILAAAVLGCSTTAFSALTVNFNENFDGFANQAAFAAAYPGDTTSGTLSTTQAKSSPNSIDMPGSTTAGYRNRMTFGEAGNVSVGDSLTWSFDFYDSNSASAPSRNFATLQDGTGTGNNQIVMMGLNNSQTASTSGGNYYFGRILGFTPSGTDPDGGAGEVAAAQTAGGYFKLNDFGVGLRSTGWHNLKVVISTADGTSQDYAFYVDNQLAEKVSGVATLRSYDNIGLGSNLSNGGTEAFYDNVSVTPEPATLACLSVAGLGLLSSRRRK